MSEPEMRHRQLAAEVCGVDEQLPYRADLCRWVQSDIVNRGLGLPWETLVRASEKLAKFEASVRAEQETRIKELLESLEMSCVTPDDHCQCSGCLYAAEKAAEDAS